MHFHFLLPKLGRPYRWCFLRGQGDPLWLGTIFLLGVTCRSFVLQRRCSFSFEFHSCVLNCSENILAREGNPWRQRQNTAFDGYSYTVYLYSSFIHQCFSFKNQRCHLKMWQLLSQNNNYHKIESNDGNFESVAGDLRHYLTMRNYLKILKHYLEDWIVTSRFVFLQIGYLQAIGFDFKWF